MKLKLPPLAFAEPEPDDALDVTTRAVEALVGALRRVLDANRDGDALGVGQGAVEAAMAAAALRPELVERVDPAALGRALAAALAPGGRALH